MREIRILALFGARVLFGQERANIETLAQLQQQGCEVLCVVRDDEWLTDIRVALDMRNLKWVELPYIDYPIRGWLMHALRRNPVAYMRGHRGICQISREFRPTHIHAFNPLYIASFWHFLRSEKLPLVYRAGDYPRPHNVFYRRIWRFIRERTNCFVADSNFIAARLTELGMDQSKIEVIYAPAPRRPQVVPFDSPGATNDASTFRFVYVGQIAEAKGVGVLVDAFSCVLSDYPNSELLIAGPITNWSGHEWARDLRAKVQSNFALAARVKFLGAVDDVDGLLRYSTVHVAPSFLEEAYGLVVIEAKSAARPSIIFKSGGMVELVSNDVDGIVVAEKKVAELARALTSYLANPVMARNHGEAAKASLRTLAIEEFGSKWRAVYEKTTPAHVEGSRRA